MRTICVLFITYLLVQRERDLETVVVKDDEEEAEKALKILSHGTSKYAYLILFAKH